MWKFGMFCPKRVSLEMTLVERKAHERRVTPHRHQCLLRNYSTYGPCQGPQSAQYGSRTSSFRDCLEVIAEPALEYTAYLVALKMAHLTP